MTENGVPGIKVTSIKTGADFKFVFRAKIIIFQHQKTPTRGKIIYCYLPFLKYVQTRINHKIENQHEFEYIKLLAHQIFILNGEGVVLQQEMSRLRN